MEERDGSGVKGFLAQNLPEELLEVSSFEELREGLVAYTKAREELEPGRSHYRALVSFEGVQGSAEVAALAREWLKTAFPNARAFGFVHQNTDNTHAHLWIDARGKDGRKIQLKNGEFKRLDESWNRIYCRATGREEAEHLDKKQKRYDEKQKHYEKRRSHPQSRPSPRETGAKAPPSGKALPSDKESAPAGEHAAPRREPGAEDEGEPLRALLEEDARALRAAQELHEGAKRLDHEAELDLDDGLFRRRSWNPEEDL